MLTLRQIVDGAMTMYAVGNSEGAKLGWDRRGRKSAEKTTERNRESARFQPGLLSIFGPEHVKELQELHKERLKKLKAGQVEEEMEQQENGAGAPAH